MKDEEIKSVVIKCSSCNDIQKEFTKWRTWFNSERKKWAEEKKELEEECKEWIERTGRVCIDTYKKDLIRRLKQKSRIMNNVLGGQRFIWFDDVENLIKKGE